MILKIALRNFTKNLKISLVVILGLAISLSLVTGALSLSDSINVWKWERIEENFGNADAVAEPKSPSFLFFSFATSKIDDSEIENLKKQVKGVLPVSEGSARLNNTLDVLVIATEPEYLSDFVGESLTLNPGEAIVGKSIAELMNLKVGDRITLLFSSGSKEFTVVKIGEKGFLNFKGESASLSGTVFINVKDFDGVFPTKCYLHYDLPVEKHEETTIETNLRVRNIKYSFLKSPINKSLAYVTLAFSGISIFVGFLVFYMFCEDVIRDRSSTLVTLRKIGLRRKEEWGILLLEGFMYSLMSASAGVLIGIFVGKFLLSRFQEVVDVISSSFFHIDKIGFHLSIRTLLLSLGLGVLFPMFLFFLKAREITGKPPVYREMGEQLDVSWKLVIFAVLLSFVLFFSELRVFSVVFLSLIIAIKLRNPFIMMALGTLNLGMGFFSSLNLQSEKAFIFSSLNKGSAIFFGVTLLVFSMVLLSKNVFNNLMSRGNLSLLIGLSYVQRFPKKGITVSLTFAFLIFSVTVFNILSASADRFVQEKVKGGLFGYNFLVLENPFRSLLAKTSLPVHEELKDPSRVYLCTLKTERGEKMIAFVDESFFRNSTLKLLRGSARSLEASDTALIGDPVDLEEITGTLKSILPLGGRKEVKFKVAGIYNKNDYLVPIDMIAPISNAPSDVKPLSLLLGRVEESSASSVKQFYLSKFAYPFFLDEEFKKLYGGIEGLVSVIKFIFLFGFLSASSGLLLFVLKSYFSRIKIMGTLRAVGMKINQLVASFLIEHLFFLFGGILIGTVSGVLMGYFVSEAMSESLGTFMVSVPTASILLSLLTVIALASAVMVIPSLMMSKLSPLEAMKEGE
ncbi:MULTISPECIES: FtsX-like permease family protein [unclassified Thermotoga]|uniref:ABC transporter permease n=1 Tax=unclassified Thermotoga TaxID=2631113 RepID=UPI000280E7A4|nr:MULTISPECIES: ABC transporter permease [unclassified Thermotoga]AIY85777.1 hypothetical protein T2812B_01130 [Thermotoga sp. 2812B]EJX26936.1 hypothetical protein EMP_01647 [Thermotoga sp. EMP]